MKKRMATRISGRRRTFRMNRADWHGFKIFLVFAVILFANVVSEIFAGFIHSL